MPPTGTRLMSKSPPTNKREKKLAPIHLERILLEDMRNEKIGINSLAQGIRVPANRIGPRLTLPRCEESATAPWRQCCSSAVFGGPNSRL